METTIDDELRGKPNLQLPYSHAAGYRAADRVELVAAADIDPDQLENARERYDVPRGYEDYREMIEPKIRISPASLPRPPPRRHGDVRRRERRPRRLL